MPLKKVCMKVVRERPLFKIAVAVEPVAVMVAWALILGYATAIALAIVCPLAATRVFNDEILPLEAVTEKATETPVDPCNRRLPALAVTLVMVIADAGKPRNVASAATNCVLKLADWASATETPLNDWV